MPQREGCEKTFVEFVEFSRYLRSIFGINVFSLYDKVSVGRVGAQERERKYVTFRF